MTGKHIVVTGAGTGIGRAIALRLGRDGASVTLVARDGDRLEAVAATIEAPTHVAACDIRDRGRVEKAFAGAVADLGPLHALVACSGVGGSNGGDARADRFDEIVATNLNGTYYCCRAALDNLAAGPEARHLVVISSILARIAVPGYTGYSASKAGLLGLVRSFAAELGEDNIQVNAICPGWVDTDMAWEGLDGIATGTGRHARGRLSRCDGGSPARTYVSTRRHRRHRGLAALARCAWRHGAGDRPERWRLGGLKKRGAPCGAPRCDRTRPQSASRCTASRPARRTRSPAWPREALAPPRCPCGPGP